MADPKDPEGDGEGARRAAGEIADGLVPMVESSRNCRLDFLAYLLGMALKEARRLSARQD
ncbi:MAG: hypothetical protein ACPW61_06110 [Methyloligella sp. ZOD6]